jgi:ectoine hydroxylase
VQTTFTEAELAQYEQNGYFVVKGLFEKSEVQKLLDFAQQDPEFLNSKYGRKDATGQATQLALWNDENDSLYSMFSRAPRVVDRMEQILGGEVYHYHTKMMLKEPRVGGAWEWHQDYGYWYHNGCLYPLLASCLIAVTAANKENGCLQVVPGSHNLGRMDHGKTGEQTGAHPEHVEAILQRLPLVYVETDPGDAILFHCNLLHRSDQNRADVPRWSIICCYNAARNDPYKDSRHPRYHKLERVSEDAIANWTPPVAAS